MSAPGQPPFHVCLPLTGTVISHPYPGCLLLRPRVSWIALGAGLAGAALTVLAVRWWIHADAARAAAGWNLKTGLTAAVLAFAVFSLLRWLLTPETRLERQAGTLTSGPRLFRRRLPLTDVQEVRVFTTDGRTFAAVAFHPASVPALPVLQASAGIGQEMHAAGRQIAGFLDVDCECEDGIA